MTIHQKSINAIVGRVNQRTHARIRARQRYSAPTVGSVDGRGTNAATPAQAAKTGKFQEIESKWSVVPTSGDMNTTNDEAAAFAEEVVQFALRRGLNYEDAKAELVHLKKYNRSPVDRLSRDHYSNRARLDRLEAEVEQGTINDRGGEMARRRAQRIQKYALRHKCSWDDAKYELKIE
ncbi:hypothetical protein Mal52_51210 [Symmachiella dynata]|uniref:Uncharacterized protein n=1 Tax=Symmachiella dynata TaxID=2527995 RepID=A0A517ZVW4_9PLAN|nr:hypothetical protein [Symmachiella dynata]QDU46599.1 hypothetical protein Mal52_51210 [Symmachiella dynata]